MGLEVFGPGNLYTHARGPNPVILNGASDNPGAPAMAEAVFGSGDLYTHARGPNRVILNGASDNPGAPAMAEGASDNPGAPAMAEAPDQFSRGGPFFPKKSVRPDQFSTENFGPPDQNFPDQNSGDRPTLVCIQLGVPLLRNTPSGMRKMPISFQRLLPF